MKYLNLILTICIALPSVSHAGKKDLLSALASGQMEKVSTLAAQIRVDSKKLYQKDEQGNTPLHWAAANGDLPLTQILLKKGSNPNAQNKSGATPLLLALLNPHALPHRSTQELEGIKTIVETLIQARADVNLARNDGTTPLLIATQNQDIPLIRILCKAGAELTSDPKHGKSPLTISLQLEMNDLVQVLLEERVGMSQLSDQEIIFLYKNAIDTRNMALLGALIEQGLSFNFQGMILETTLLIDFLEVHLDDLIAPPSLSRQLTRIARILAILGSQTNFSDLTQELNLLAVKVSNPRSRAEHQVNLNIQKEKTRLAEVLPKIPPMIKKLKEHAKNLMNKGILDGSIPNRNDQDTPSKREDVRQCLSCWDTLTESTQAPTGPAGCECPICIPCAQTLIDSELSNSNTRVSRCPGENCHKIWSPDFLKIANKSEQEIETFHVHLLERILSENPKWHFCPTPDCQGGIEIKSSSSSKYLHCPLCDQSACTNCGEKDHRAGSCDQYLNNQSKAQISERFIQKQLHSKQFRPCPNCHTPTKKAEGCNHMTCSRCGQNWNWKTGIPM